MTVDNKHHKRPRVRKDAWPFKSQNSSPLAWWRLLPRKHFRDAERLVLDVSLERVAVLHAKPQLRAALGGSTEATLRAALSELPIREISLNVDLIMSTVLRSALNGSPAAMLVLESVLGDTDLGHHHAAELSESWRIEYARSFRSVPALPNVEETALSEAVYEYLKTETGRASK